MVSTSLRKIGGYEYRKSEKCDVCKRSFDTAPFGHHFRTSWGSIDVCEPCAEDMYTSIATDIASGIFVLKRDVEEIKKFLNNRSKGKKK